MDDLSYKTLIKATPKLTLANKLRVISIFASEFIHNKKPHIAVILWAILFYRMHIVGFYSPKGSDAISILGIFVAVVALCIAESQLMSWKQEKLLDRLEAVLFASIRLRDLTSSLECNLPRDAAGNPKLKDLSDADIELPVSLIRAGFLNKEHIVEECAKLRHQFIFIKKLLGNRSFKLNKAKEVSIFLDLCDRYLIHLEFLMSSAHYIIQDELGIIKSHSAEGFHARLLNDFYGFWPAFNHHKSPEAQHPAESMIPPGSIIEMRIRALVNTLRI